MYECPMLIEVFVSPKEGDKGSIGTGYPVGPNRVITASHILGDRPEATEVRWYYADDDTAAHTWRKVNRVASRDEELDVAVLECDFPAGTRDWEILLERVPQKGESWFGEGFIEAGRRGDARNAEAFDGTVKKGCEEDGRMVLGVENPPSFAAEPIGCVEERAERLWEGGSGSPVIVCGCLAGVIT